MMRRVRSSSRGQTDWNFALSSARLPMHRQHSNQHHKMLPLFIYAALEDLLAKVMPAMSQRDVLVFLGDYIDRGPDTRGCLDRMVRLRDEVPCPLVTLLGNHEDWMLKTMRDSTRHSWILGMEAFETIASYSVEAAVR